MVIVLSILSLIVIIVVVYICLVKPEKRRVQQLPCQNFAHRGLHGNGVPENSLLAFAKAKELGLGVELDVQLTRDKQLVVFHDTSLERMCGIDIRVGDATYSQLQQFRLGNSDEKIPLLVEVLQLMDGLPIICEIKPYGGTFNTEICEYVCQAIDDYPGPILIESFNPFIIRWFRLHRPEIIRGQLSMDFIKRREGLRWVEAFVMKHLLINCLGRPDFIAYRWDDDSLGFKLCRLLFKPWCFAWTVLQPWPERLWERFHAFIFERH